MGYDGTLKFDTRVDESGFNSGIGKLGNIAKSGLKVLAGAVASVTATMGAGVVAGVKYNASIEQYQTSFEVMTGSAEKAVEVIERLKKVGAETPFELNNLADTTQLLMNYGFTADEAMDKMMMLGDISQGSADKMQRVATAYGQMSSAGKVSLEDVKQMIEAGFNPLQEISQSTGESMASLYERISDGTIAVDEITASMQRATSEGGKYFQSMEKQSQTLDGLISTLKDNALQLLGEVVRPVTEAFRSELLPAAIDTVEQLTNIFSERGTEGLIEAGKQIINNLLFGIMEIVPQVPERARQIVELLLGGIQQYAPSMITAGTKLLANFISGIAQQLPTLIPQALATVVTLADNIISNLPIIINAGISLLKGIVTGIINSLPILIQEGPRIINDFADAIYSGLWELIKAGAELIVSLVKGLLENLPLLLENAGEILLAFINIFSLSKLFSLGKSLITKLAEGIKKVGPNVVKAGGSIVDALVSGIKKFATNPVTALKDIAKKALDAVKKLDWKNLGKNILDGIVNGVKKNASKILKALKDAAGAALEGVKDFLGIESPSKVFRDQVGKYMALGVGVGFDKNIPVDDMAGTLTNSVQTMQRKVSAVTQNAGDNIAGRVNAMYGAKGSENTSSEAEEINLHVTNVFEVDGTPLVEKTTKATIKKINGNQKSDKKVKGQ